jgi:hypothetical protein
MRMRGVLSKIYILIKYYNVIFKVKCGVYNYYPSRFLDIYLIEIVIRNSKKINKILCCADVICVVLCGVVCAVVRFELVLCCVLWYSISLFIP